MSLPTTLERLQVVTNNTTGGRDTLTLESIPTSWKIVDLKRHLVSKMNISSGGGNSNDDDDENSKIGRLRLIFRGQPLQDETLLSRVSGLTSGTTMHVLIRPAAAPASSSTNNNSNTSSTNTNNTNMNNLNAQLDGAANQLLGSLLGGGGGRNNNTSNNNNNAGGSGGGAGAGADLGNLVGGLLQGVLGGIGNATSNNNNNTTNTNTTRSATFGNTTVRVHDLTGGNINNNNNNTTNNNRARSPGTTNNATSTTQQQQQQQSATNTNTTTNPRNLSLPPAMVHVHVTPEQLDSLPDQLVRFYDNFSRRTGATQSFDPARLVQLQLEQQQQQQNSSASSPLGNLINSVSGLVSNLSGELHNNNQSQQQQQSSTNSNEDESVSAILSRYTNNNITPAEPFVSQANFVPLKDRVSNAVKDVVAHRGVGALLPLINGDWEPLSLFRAPIENALRQPYMSSASRDSVASAIVREFQQAVSESDSSFAADGEGNPLYQVLANEMTSASSPGEDAAVASSSSSSSGSSRQIFNKIRNILLRAAMTDGLDLILPPTTTTSSSSSSSSTRWSTQVRNLVVRTSGQVVNVLRNDAKLSPASIEKILREVANLAAPLMQNMNPMMSMMVQSNGPQLIQEWANEYDANPENYVAATGVTSTQGTTSSTTTTAANNNTNNNNNKNNNNVAAAAANNGDDDDDDDDLDALLDDAMDDYNTTSTTTTSAATASNNNNINSNQQQQSQQTNGGGGGGGGLGLAQALQQVEGLDNESVQAIMRMTNQALGGNGSNNSSTGGSQQNYFY